MRKETIFAGLGGGVLFGAIESFSVGAVDAFYSGLVFGVGISLFLHLLVNPKSAWSQINVPDEMLLPGERIVFTKPANLVVEPKNFNLESLACDGLLWSVGMKNKESLGGAMHLTNYRILFRSHRFNRLRGMTSIFLPTIQQLENRTVLIFRKLTVSTISAQVEFVVSDVAGVISQIAATRDRMDATAVAALQNHAALYPERCSGELASWRAMDKLNSLVKFGKRTADAAQAITNPWGALGSIFLSELLEKTVAEKWQQVFHAPDRPDARRPPKRTAA